MAQGPRDLPHLDGNPLLQLGAAKLLFFINRGHLELAERLADGAFLHSTAFAAAHSTRAQMLMCRGEITEAIRLYDNGLELCSYGSVFHIYLLALKCTAQLAADDRAGVAATARELFSASPKSRADLGILVASPATPRLTDDLELQLSAYTPEFARTVLSFFYHTSARHFLSAVHRANVMRGPAAHIQRKLGPQSIPEEVARALAVG